MNISGILRRNRPNSDVTAWQFLFKFKFGCSTVSSIIVSLSEFHFKIKFVVTILFSIVDRFSIGVGFEWHFKSILSSEHFWLISQGIIPFYLNKTAGVKCYCVCVDILKSLGKLTHWRNWKNKKTRIWVGFVSINQGMSWSCQYY